MYDGDDDDDVWWWCILRTAISFSSAAYLCTKGIDIKLLILYSKFWDSKIICVTFSYPFHAASLQRYLQSGWKYWATRLASCSFASSLVPLLRLFRSLGRLLRTACVAPRSTVLVRLLAHSRKMVVFDVSVSGYLVTLLQRQPWSPSAFDENSPNMMATLHCSAVGVRLLLLALIESCFQFKWYNGFDFLLIRKGDIGSSKKKVSHKREEKIQKRKKKMILQRDKNLV